MLSLVLKCKPVGQRCSNRPLWVVTVPLCLMSITDLITPNIHLTVAWVCIEPITFVLAAVKFQAARLYWKSTFNIIFSRNVCWFDRHCGFCLNRRFVHYSLLIFIDLSEYMVVTLETLLFSVEDKLSSHKLKTILLNSSSSIDVFDSVKLRTTWEQPHRCREATTTPIKIKNPLARNNMSRELNHLTFQLHKKWVTWYRHNGWMWPFRQKIKNRKRSKSECSK